MTTDTIADLRRLTRDLRPSYLDDLGLAPALGLLARQVTGELAIPVEFMSSGEPRRLPPPVELAAYRIVQEALRNVGRHARATHVTVALDFAAGQATLTVADDGEGFDAGRLGELALGGHFGLLGARERAEAVGATLALQSTPGQGTRVVMTWAG
jgi:signal transduction histidine kinase